MALVGVLLAMSPRLVRDETASFPKGNTPKRGRTPELDALIGSRVMLGRRLAGMTQEGLALVVGVSFQHIQKYESGSNRIAASTLTVIAVAVSQPLAFFFPGKLEESTPGAEPLGREELGLAGDFSKVSNANVRGAVLRLVATLAREH